MSVSKVRSGGGGLVRVWVRVRVGWREGVVEGGEGGTPSFGSAGVSADMDGGGASVVPPSSAIVYC